MFYMKQIFTKENQINILKTSFAVFHMKQFCLSTKCLKPVDNSEFSTNFKHFVENLLIILPAPPLLSPYNKSMIHIKVLTYKFPNRFFSRDKLRRKCFM